MPKGCLEISKKIYFNNDANGVAISYGRPVCKKKLITVELGDMKTNGCSEYLTATECETYANTPGANLHWQRVVTINKM